MFRFKHPSVPNTRSEQKPEQSNRSTTPGVASWKKALAISALPLAFIFGAAFQLPNNVSAQLTAIQFQIIKLQAQVASLADKRKFYVTQTFHNGAEALSACAQGYHMASMWEIRDTSNLRYDRDLGTTTADSGFGPPALTGWIRTGGNATGVNDAGRGNCHAWTSVADDGTVVFLNDIWQGPGVSITPWVAGLGPCSASRRVWCVQD